MQMQRKCKALSPEKHSIEKWYCVGVSLRQWRRNYVSNPSSLLLKGGFGESIPQEGD